MSHCPSVYEVYSVNALTIISRIKDKNKNTHVELKVAE